MKLINKTKDILFDNEFYLKIFTNKLYIANFINLGEVTSEKIIVRHESGYIIIKGKDITLSKLQSKEVLIKGVFNLIEFR